MMMVMMVPVSRRRVTEIILGGYKKYFNPFETSMIPIDAEFREESIPHHPRARSRAKKAETAKKLKFMKIIVLIPQFMKIIILFRTPGPGDPKNHLEKHHFHSESP